MKDSLCGGLDKSAHAGHEYFYLVANEESGKIKDIQTETLESRGNYVLLCELKEDVANVETRIEKNQEDLKKEIEKNQEDLKKEIEKNQEDLKKDLKKEIEKNQEDLKKEIRKMMEEVLDARKLN
jgi:F0F1-type ATP synthase membrane subunit b/b'